MENRNRPPVKKIEKLVRDRIPHILEEAGVGYGIRSLSPPEVIMALKAKLVEEAQEVARASDRQGLILELADVWEVFESLCERCHIERSHVESIRRQRRQERGGFDQGIQLLFTESPPETPQSSGETSNNLR